MGIVTAYCIVSGCTPGILVELDPHSDESSESYGPVVTSAIESLADEHENNSQDDICVITPADPSGNSPWQEETFPSDSLDLPPESDIRVIPHCVLGGDWDGAVVDAPLLNREGYNGYSVIFGYALMVQTYALDIMALATHGRMTPLRLWRLAIQQGYTGIGDSDCLLKGVDYGEITGQWEQYPNLFPRFTKQQLVKLEAIGDIEVVKQHLVLQGYFWIWMAPDRFPVTPTELDYDPPMLPDVHPSASRSAIESFPPEILTLIASSLPLTSLLDLASTSWLLRTRILGSDYLACVWLYENAPWWIPVPTQTPKRDDDGEPPTTAPQLYLASEWSPDVHLTVDFPAGLDWGYVMRCVRSGSMLNRERIWKTVLSIEQVADLAEL